MEGWEPRGVLRELCLRAVCVVVKVAGVAWAGMWRAKKGAERRRKCDLRVFFVAKMWSSYLFARQPAKPPSPSGENQDQLLLQRRQLTEMLPLLFQKATQLSQAELRQRSPSHHSVVDPRGARPHPLRLRVMRRALPATCRSSRVKLSWPYTCAPADSTTISGWRASRIA